MRKVGRNVLADPVAEILLLRFATHVDEWQYADRSIAVLDGVAGNGLASRCSGQRLQALHQSLPLGPAGFASPFRPVEAMNLIERQRWQGLVERKLDQRSGDARGLGLCPDPLRGRRLGRP